MTHHTPLTHQQLNEISSRADGIASQLSGWLRRFGPIAGYESIDRARTVLIEDVPALLADLRRGQAQREFLIAQLARKDARAGDGERALREFLTANPDEGEMAASMARDGFGSAEIADMLSHPPRPASGPQAAASEETNR